MSNAGRILLVVMIGGHAGCGTLIPRADGTGFERVVLDGHVLYTLTQGHLAAADASATEECRFWQEKVSRLNRIWWSGESASYHRETAAYIATLFRDRWCGLANRSRPPIEENMLRARRAPSSPGMISAVVERCTSRTFASGDQKVTCKPASGHAVTLIMPVTVASDKQPFKETRTTDATGKASFAPDPLMFDEINEVFRPRCYLVVGGQEIDIDAKDFYDGIRRGRVAQRSRATELSGLPPCAQSSAAERMGICPAWYQAGRCHDGEKVVEQGCINPSDVKDGGSASASDKTTSIAVTLTTTRACAGQPNKRIGTSDDTLQWTYNSSTNGFAARLSSWSTIPAKSTLVLTGTASGAKAKLTGSVTVTIAGTDVTTNYVMGATIAQGEFVDGKLASVIGGCALLSEIRKK